MQMKNQKKTRVAILVSDKWTLKTVTRDIMIKGSIQKDVYMHPTWEHLTISCQ